MKVNDMLHGFRLIRQSEIKEISAETFLFEHEKSGARLFYVKNEDDNKVFHITFRTPPKDDTGVAHIVEHSTLCGSRKYPLKEPFVELVKGSLNTFLNAMTYPDKTMYPVASRNDKDFQNLMDVYLDAVFYPAMRENPQVLMQEGWHYEIDNPEAPLQYSGVVYNEMKGALSDPDDLLTDKITQALYPDTTYHYESGGDPAAIPQLTQEKFIAFHSRFYHPSNSYIYLYGDMDIEEKLAYLDREYLSHFDRIEVDSEIAAQQPFTEMKRVQTEYPIGADEDTKDKTYLSLVWSVPSIDAETALGVDVLMNALLTREASPLRQALLDAHLGKDVDTASEAELRQPFLGVTVNGSEPERAEKFYGIVMDCLKKYAEEGLERTLLEASLNSTEFHLREADFGSTPKGLIYGIQIMKSWLYDGEPEEYLRYEAALKTLRDGLKTHYYEDLIRRILIDNPYCVLLTMQPSRTLAAEKEKRTAEELAARKAEMTPADIENIIADVKALKERQQSPETPEALATIPLLKLSDIKADPEHLPLEVREEGDTKVLWSELETNGIVYLKLLFDTSAVPQDKLQYINLLNDILGAVDTKQHSYSELSNLRGLHTGGISFGVEAITKEGEPDSLLPTLRVKAKALVPKLPQLLALLAETFTESVFTDKKRVRELVEESVSTIETGMQRSAHRIVSSSVSSYFTQGGVYANLSAMPYYHFLKDFLADFDTSFVTMQQVFAEILPRIFNRPRLIVSITGNEKTYDAFQKAWPTFTARLSQGNYETQVYHFDTVKRNEGFTSSSQVQYVGKGANFLKLGYAYTGSMHVLETLLRYGFLWTKVRVQGGAYGAFTNFNRNGDMFFGSYRDPHLRKTLAVFDDVADWVSHFDCDDREMLKAVIGTVSGLDTPLTPVMKGSLAATRYLRGVKWEDIAKARHEVLAVTPQKIRDLAPLIDACMKEDAFCVFGNADKVNEAKDIFGTIEPAL